MKEVRMRAVVDAAKCTGCDTCIHVCPTIAYTKPKERPINRQKLPPCSRACPAGNDVEGMITLVQGGKWEAALNLLLNTNPLPGVTGRVCNSPCEDACNRGNFDNCVSIRTLERVLAEYASKKSFKMQGLPRHNEKVAIVGSGPAGISCAFHLARRGFGVTVFEKQAKIGGTLRYGIPAYRLPKDVLDRELGRLHNLGIDFRPNKELGNNLLMKDLQNYDAVYFALGFHKALDLGIPGEGCPQVIGGLSFLERVNSDAPPQLGARALVVGGGNTAVDSARSALRLGARTTLVYRRREEDMPAIKTEIEDLKSEGVEILVLSTPIRFVTRNERLVEIECIKMAMGQIEKDGRRRPVPIPSSEFIFSADTVIVCVGETGDLQRVPPELKSEKGRIVADFFGHASMPKVFAGGDIATGEGTVAHAIGSGRRGAEAIESYLLGDSESVQEPERPVVSAEEMNFDYCDPTAGLRTSRIPVERAILCFDEIHQTPAEKESVSETERCLHCGVVPEFHPEHCFGCTNCSSRCPSYAISLMELEEPYVVKVDMEEEMFEEICRICEKAVIHPESLVCQCTGTRADEIVAAILKGAKNVVDIRRMTGAHTGCGSACLGPIFRLIQAAGIDINIPPSPDYYPSTLSIWDIPDQVIRDFEARGFRFEEDKDFFNNWLEHIRTYCGKKESVNG
jgi:NADPH-dependent glutamate synthase beta subunit-like oxidoreductase/bacterioferritin-associated ferredoxin/NAD-dependent dihydropyrimidine dehydrogenase PreA subunit